MSPEPRLQARFAQAERGEIFARLAATPWKTLSQLPHTRITALVLQDVDRSVIASQQFVRLTVALVTLAANLAVAMVFSAALTALSVVLVAILGAMAWGRRGNTMMLGNEDRRALAAMASGSSQFLAGLKTATAEHGQSAYLARIAGKLDRIRLGMERHQFEQAHQRVVSGRVGTLFAALLIAGGIILSIAPAKLLATVLVISRMNAQTVQIQQTFHTLLAVLPSFRELESIRAVLAPAADGSPDVTPLTGRLELRGVQFTHGARKEAGDAATRSGIGPIDLAIEPGEWIGITGSSGVGKTTLLDVVAGLFKPDSGTVTVRGLPLDGENLPRWQSGLAYLSQSVFLVNDSLRANLMLSGQCTDDAAMHRELERVGIGNLVGALPGGLDCAVGEAGATLSGGERQRVALARALLRRPGLLILDEALAAVDVETEGRILESLAGVDWTMAVIVVAHRRESLARCSRVLAMEAGRLISSDSSG